MDTDKTEHDVCFCCKDPSVKPQMKFKQFIKRKSTWHYTAQPGKFDKFTSTDAVEGLDHSRNFAPGSPQQPEWRPDIRKVTAREVHGDSVGVKEGSWTSYVLEDVPGMPIQPFTSVVKRLMQDAETGTEKARQKKRMGERPAEAITNDIHFVIQMHKVCKGEGTTLMMTVSFRFRYRGPDENGRWKWKTPDTGYPKAPGLNGATHQNLRRMRNWADETLPSWRQNRREWQNPDSWMAQSDTKGES